MATLLLELSLTRIFSVVFYYHFAFLAISIALFSLAEGPGTVIASAVVFAAAAAIWHSMAGSKAGRAGSVALALVLMIFLVDNHDGSVLGVRHAKEHLIANEVFHRWNSFSRIGVVQPPGSADASIVID